MGIEENLVDLVWGKERPPRPNEKVKVLGDHFNGKKFQEKIDDVRKELEKKKSAGLIVCTYYSSYHLKGLILTQGISKLCWTRSPGYTISVAMS